MTRRTPSTHGSTPSRRRDAARRVATSAAFVLLAVALTPGELLSQWKAGVRQIRLTDASRGDRPVWVDLFYPAAATAQEESLAFGFVGSFAWNGEMADDQRWPVALLSHGAMGSARNYSWLAGRLARSGYVVLGVSHHGESWLYGPAEQDPSAVLRMWERPLDLSFALTALLEHPDLEGRLDPGRVAAVGHSSGGNSAIALAGPVFDGRRLADYCASEASRDDRGCRYGDSAAPEDRSDDRPPAQAPPPGTSHRDDRVRAVVALDPAVGPAYSAASLSTIDVPVLIIGAVDNDFLPFEHHARHYAAGTPGARLVGLDQGEGHFVFLDLCDTDLAANGVPLCTDRENVDRAQVHLELADQVLSFLGEALGGAQKGDSP